MHTCISFRKYGKMKIAFQKKYILFGFLLIIFLLSLPFTHSFIFTKIVRSNIQKHNHDANLESAYINIYKNIIDIKKIHLSKPTQYHLNINRIESRYDLNAGDGYKSLEEIKINGGKLSIEAIPKKEKKTEAKLVVKSLEVKDFSIALSDVFPQMKNIGGGVLIKHAYLPPTMKIVDFWKEYKLDIIGFDKECKIYFDETSEQLKVRKMPLVMFPLLEKFGLDSFTSGYIDVDISLVADETKIFSLEIRPRELSLEIPEDASFGRKVFLRSVVTSANLLENKAIKISILMQTEEADALLRDLKYLKFEKVIQKIKSIKWSIL